MARMSECDVHLLMPTMKNQTFLSAFGAATVIKGLKEINLTLLYSSASVPD